MLVCHLISVLVGLNVLVLSPRPLLSIVALFICQFSPHNHTLPSYETQICVESFIHLFIHSFIRTFILSPIYSFAQLRLLGPVLCSLTLICVSEGHHQIPKFFNYPVCRSDLKLDPSMSSAAGIEYLSGSSVTILASKTSQRYRLQSDDFHALWLVTEELTRRVGRSWRGLVGY